MPYIGNLPGKDYQPLIISTPFTKMLVHKMRAENDAILVGKTTEELEQPQADGEGMERSKSREIGADKSTDKSWRIRNTG